MRKKEVKIEEEPWDRRKIIIAVLFFLVCIFAFLYFKNTFSPSKVKIESAFKNQQTVQDPRVSQATEKFQENLDKIKQNAQNLNMVDVATSSPQVQKVINDIKALQDLPKSQAKEACERICSGL